MYVIAVLRRDYSRLVAFGSFMYNSQVCLKWRSSFQTEESIPSVNLHRPHRHFIEVSGEGRAQKQPQIGPWKGCSTIAISISSDALRL